MAEGMMSFYPSNSFTFLNSPQAKKWVHILLQILGSAFAIIGVYIEIYSKWGRTHFTSNHAILGELLSATSSKYLYKIFIHTGLVSTILLFITFFNGIFAMNSMKLKKFLKPLHLKISHNLLSIGAFVIGMASIIDGYLTKRVMQTNDPGDVRYWMVVFSIVSVILTVLGPLKNLYSQISDAF